MIKHKTFEEWSKGNCYLKVRDSWTIARTDKEKRQAYEEEKIRTIAREKARAKGKQPEI